MKRVIITINAIILFSACGGGSGSDNYADRDLRVRFSEPASLMDLPTKNREYSLSLKRVLTADDAPDTELQSAIIPITIEEGDDTYRGVLESIAPGNYDAKVMIAYPVDGAPSQSIPIAVHEFRLTIVVGQNEVIIDIAPSDFNLDVDTDADGMRNIDEVIASANALVADSDGDGVMDGLDLFPMIATETGDADSDGIGNSQDICWKVSNPYQLYVDDDELGDACDADSDNDMLSDLDELKYQTDPLNPDTDGDSVLDGQDNCPLISNKENNDTDGDGVGNACDDNDDNDDYLDDDDNCPLVASSSQLDTDGDGMGDDCIDDDDGDGVLDINDNCRYVANTNQLNVDDDELGDACDADSDNDGTVDQLELNRHVYGYVTDPLAMDSDGDGVIDPDDNCPITPNPMPQSDTDSDGEGDVCDCSPWDSNIHTHGALFVSPSGNDDGDGSRQSPFKSIMAAMGFAKDNDYNTIYVTEGTYSESVNVHAGINLQGGFKLNNNGQACEHRLVDDNSDANQTNIIGECPVMTLRDIDQITYIGGMNITCHGPTALSSGPALKVMSDSPSTDANIYIHNNYIATIAEDVEDSTGNAVGITIDGAKPIFENNIIWVDGYATGTVVSIINCSSPKFTYNTIGAFNISRTSYGIRYRNSAPTLVNNIIYTSSGHDQTIIKSMDSKIEAMLRIQNNMLFGMPDVDGLPVKFYTDYTDSVLGRAHTQLDSFESISESILNNITFSGNLDKLFIKVSNRNMRLQNDSPAKNAGVLWPMYYAPIGEGVMSDHDFVIRRELHPSIGAFE